MKELRRTVCNRDCPDACGLVATVEDGRVTALRGDRDHPVTRGFLCYRTALFLETQYSPARLTTPLVRRDGALEPISWEGALDLAAEGLERIRRESGPAAIFNYRSGGTLGLLGYAVDAFFESLGPVTIKRGDICSGAGDAAQKLDFGDEDSNDLFDLHHARSILIWGKNVYTSSPHTIPVLKEARARGARLILIDPVHHRTANLCERFLQPRPGGDFALAMAVARILLDEGWTDPGAPAYSDHWDAFAALARRRSVEAWCRDAEVEPSEALVLARCLGVERPCAILVGWGMGRRVNGAGIVRALDALGTISGNVGVSGGGVSFYFKRRGAFDTSFVGGAAAAPRTIAEPLFGQEVLAAKDPPIRAVWITAGNPVAMLPASHTTVEALASRELVVVVDSFLTDTAKQATLVLPTTTLLEADDLLGAYGHHWLGVARPVVDPPEGVRSDLQILAELAGRLGLGGSFSSDPAEWKRRMIEPRLGAHAITLESLEAVPVRNPLAPPVLYADRTPSGGVRHPKFPTATGRVNLVTEEPPRAPERPGYPLTLMALSTDRSQSSQWARPLEGPIEATVHPDAVPGLADGAIGWLESTLGRIEVRIRHDAKQRRDVVLLPKGGHLSDGRCANALIHARTTDLGEGGALYDERVRIVAQATG